ncbi:DEHA2C15136p [Debaryomyces hansenii CBS767]|uniref:DEHA2C15136p n=1 Tax=Debaryomyces hansenii (strain ATCC 36239 / CBS 767 / BCRC 21394 / JCM 1990 / NBRC 0083 / IGC 2968) TaxID=284592 RepID=Q6BTX7_DEBHA|nr:DEHA2C15136p [Debaryomyces hansenii CBS767]CAG86422.2 DEHA2C15136p [Debaryomyces hansenii CBS767]|eukprot:XP_458342.2 DEHA2C15136p [Debaryomyces hansenii CBS767]
MVQDSDGSISGIILGCSVAIISSAIQSLGITLQRKSHLLTHCIGHNHHYHQRYKRNMWFLGFMLFIIANVFGSLIQLTTLPLIILSPLQSIGLIFNAILSCLLLPGEKFTKKLAIGTMVIANGAFIVAFNGNVEPAPVDDNKNKEFKLILEKLTRKSFLGWFMTTYFVIAVLILLNLIISRRKQNLKRLRKRRSRLQTTLLSKYQFTMGINYGLIAGTLTAHTFLFAKSLIDVVIEIILRDKHSFSNIFQSSNFTPYLLLIIMLAIIACQLTAFNLGLTQISTSILYPLCFLVFNLVNLINDLVFNSLLSDHRITYGQLSMVILGLIGVLLGVVIISCDSTYGDSGKDDINNLKFPYNENSTLLSPSTYSLHTIESSKMSYEQNQLINSLGI